MDKRSDARPTVLVVEDFEDNRFMMRRLLEMSGYRVVEAVNGNQAVEAAERERPDIILMDLSLPMLDGLPGPPPPPPARRASERAHRARIGAGARGPPGMGDGRGTRLNSSHNLIS